MEPKIKFLSWSVGVIGAIAIVAIVMVGFSYKKIAALEQFAQRNGGLYGAHSQSSNDIIVRAVEKKEFAGMPTSNAISAIDGNKVIELQGHIVKNPNGVGVMATVSPRDISTQKVVVSPNTRIIRATREGKNAPILTDVAFNTFSIGALTDLYVASYEAGDGGAITDATPATILHIYGRAK